MRVSDLPDDQLRALIERQLDNKRKADARAAELAELLTESIGEFHRRVVASQAPAAGREEGT